MNIFRVQSFKVTSISMEAVRSYLLMHHSPPYSSHVFNNAATICLIMWQPTDLRKAIRSSTFTTKILGHKMPP